MARLRVVLIVGLLAATTVPLASADGGPAYRIARVVDGDTIDLTNGKRVRLVQIDTPEVYGGYECYGPAASATAKRLLPVGTLVRLLSEPASEPVDQYGRLLRYVVRVGDGLNVNVQLVKIGAATPWFYDGERGRYATKLDAFAKQARAQRLGLWRACPRTVYDPYGAVRTMR